MNLLCVSTFLTIISSLCLLAASPISSRVAPPSISERHSGNCSDLRQNLTTDCWNKLNMTEYLNRWWQANSTQCTQTNTSFVSCYQQSVGYVQQQCDATGPSMCDYPGDFAGYTPQEAYTLYTIFAVWQWFQSIYDAIGNADLSATGTVGKIVKTINPEESHAQPLGDFLQALSALTPLLNAPAALVKTIGWFTKPFTETAMRQSPGVIKQLSPTGTLDSEFVQVNNLYDGLSTIKTTYQQNISNALALVQGNFTTFSLFAADGAFIAPRESLQADTVNLTLSLETYIISQCLTANNIIVTLARETNPQQLASNGSLTTTNLISCASYDEYGVCSDWWYDPGTNAAYGLASITKPDKNYYDLMETMFSSGWTTGADLFLGAKACADYVAMNGGDKGPGLDPVTMKPRCISNIQICVWDFACPLDDEGCEFTGEYGWNGCKPQQDYLREGCAGAAATTPVEIPAAYLGALDTTTDSSVIVCT